MRDLDKPYAYLAFPFVSKGPNGEEQTFDSEGEVPAGWSLPDGSKKGGKQPKAEKPVEAPKPPVDNAGPTTDGAEQSQQPETDIDGTPFDATMHTGTKTKSGQWRMKVGVKRPEKAEAAPVEKLDL